MTLDSAKDSVSKGLRTEQQKKTSGSLFSSSLHMRVHTCAYIRTHMSMDMRTRKQKQCTIDLGFYQNMFIFDGCSPISSASMVTICQGPRLKCYPPVELSHSRTISGKLCAGESADNICGMLSYKDVPLPHSQGLGTIKEEGTERAYEPEVTEDQMKQCLLDMVELLNSRQPWLPA